MVITEGLEPSSHLHFVVALLNPFDRILQSSVTDVEMAGSSGPKPSPIINHRPIDHGVHAFLSFLIVFSGMPMCSCCPQSSVRRVPFQLSKVSLEFNDPPFPTTLAILLLAPCTVNWSLQRQL